jgi:hypothetical protein
MLTNGKNASKWEKSSGKWKKMGRKWKKVVDKWISHENNKKFCSIITF